MRAAIFIDGAYLLSFLKKNNIEPKYDELSDYLLKPLRKSVPLDLLRCYFYYCAPWMSPEPTDSEKRRMEEHDAFMDEITSLPRWGVRLGKLHRRRDGNREYFEQKRVDVLLSVDMVRHSAAGHIQHVIVVAGDSDFIPAIEATKESGATVSLWYGDENTIHRDLLALADITHKIDWKKFPGKKIKDAKPGILSRLRSGSASVSSSGSGQPSGSDQRSGRDHRRRRRRPSNRNSSGNSQPVS
ncbi:MAG TPA: NYN domain-containing protein [Spirochaetota bacterium]|nr:NYN domain-containing protein [Spirochaetota bacterium]